ncbi:AAA family ATPase [Kitasatospora sp. NPDC048540]|uniref:ATP-binding protein n=1 Tax=Kitasatospora sp. NPDC048540 TaxID=3155634 RepID=UPI003403282B
MLRGLRRAAGLTQEKLAAAAGVSARSIRELERGRRGRPQNRTVQMLASALGLTGPQTAALLAVGRAGPAGIQVADDKAAGSGLLDRDGQLALLEKAASIARSGRGRVALVRAGAGMGKTSLLKVWAERERWRGVQVVWAGGSELEGEFAFSIARRLAEAVLGSAGEADRDRLLGGPAHLATRILAPEDDPGSVAELPDAQIGVMHGLYWLMVHAADTGPLALVVDDAHWADLASLRWLAYLARRLEGLPVLLVMAARPAAPAHAEAVLDEITAQPDCHLVDLPALSHDSAARLVRAGLGQQAHEAFARACARATDGNPLLLRELIRTLGENHIEPTGENIHQVADLHGRVLATTVLKRLTRQNEATVALARVLVALPDGSRWDLAADLGGMGQAETADHADALTRIGVLQAADTVRFTHPLIRTMIIESITTARQLADAHASTARILYEDGAAGEVIAAHLLQAEPTGEAWRAEALREAARTATRRGAPQESATYLRRAVHECPEPGARARVFAELGEQEVATDPGAAVAHLTRALDAITDPIERAHTAATLAAALYFRDRHDQAIDVLARAVTDLEQTGTPGRELSWRLQAQLVLTGYGHPATVAHARQWAERLRRLNLPGDTPAERTVLAALVIPAMSGEASATATNDLIDRALRGGSVIDGPVSMLFGYACFGLVATDRLDDAAVHYGQYADLGSRHGSPLLSTFAALGHGMIANRRGQIPVALAISQADLPAFAAGKDRIALAFTKRAITALIEREELDEAARLMDTYIGADLLDNSWDCSALLVGGQLQAARGQTHAALATFQQCATHEQRVKMSNPATRAWRSEAALAHAALGQRDQALALAREELDLSHAWGTPRAIGVSLRTLGVITQGRTGLDLLHQAADTLAGSPARLEHARALHELGAAACHLDHPDTGRPILLQAHHLAQECGSLALARRTRTALTAINADPGPPPPTTPILPGLEYKVATLAATGHTDRQIAQSLMTTQHAVQEAIDNACRRLHLPDRTHLPAALASTHTTRR